MNRLDPIALARLKRQLRCPDCDSIVKIDQTVTPAHGTVEHDDTCLALASLERQGRGSQLVLVPLASETAADFAAAVGEAARVFGGVTGSPVRVATHPYTDLGGDAA